MPYLTEYKYKDQHHTNKVRFFWDYFHHANQRLGLIEEFAFDSPVYRIENIRAQINTNGKFSLTYITNHIEYLFLKHMKYLIKHSECSKLVEYINEFLGTNSKRRRKEIIADNDFIENVNSVYSYLKDAIFEDVLLRVIRLLACPHSLKIHKLEIKYYALIILCEFRFEEFSKEDLRSLHKNVMTTDANKFSFPSDIFIDCPSEKRWLKMKEHIKNLDFKSQLEAIKNFKLNSNRTCIVYYKITNYEIDFKEFEEFNYSNVRFLSLNHDEVKFLRSKRNDHFWPDYFFKNEEEPYIVAATEVHFNSQDIAVKKAYDRIIKAVKRLNRVLHHEGYVVSKKVLLKLKSGKVYPISRSSNSNRKIDKHCLRRIKDNPYEYLKNCKPESKQPILIFEQEYLEALADKNVVLLWKYIENILHPQSDFKNKYREVFSVISLIQYRESIKSELKRDFSISASSHSISHKELGLTRNEQNTLVGHPEKIPMRKYKSRTKNLPYLKELIYCYERHASKRNLKSIHTENLSLMSEAQEYRNSIIHSGQANLKLRHKLQTVFPRLVVKFRWTIIQGIKDNPSTKYSDILLRLYKEGKLLV